MGIKKSIYIIDDVHENLQVLGNILKNDGYNISVARNGKQALEGINIKLPDLILLDISMPEMDGYEVCKELKSQKETAEIPVIFLTARTHPVDIVKGFKVGGVDYITKPFNSEELLSRIKTHLELKKAREELLEINATKDKFFRIIGHDLKSPLSVLINFTSLLVEKMDTFSQEEMKKILVQLNEHSLATYKLLENLLSWSKSQSGNIDFKPEKIKINKLINETIHFFKNEAKNKSIHLENEINGNCIAFADKNMINSVLRNLFSNAIKFTFKGGKVTTKCREINGVVEIAVIDTGMGISPDAFDKLFKIETHYSTQGTANEKGSGLGLILCKEFIEKHEGKIWVESKKGEGSSFKFTLNKLKSTK